MINVFTPKRISPDCLFKSNHRKVKNSILFPRCAIYLRSMLHTAEIISAVCCTPLRSSLWCVQRSSLLCDAHQGDNLCGMLQSPRYVVISAVCCNLRGMLQSPRYVFFWPQKHTLEAPFLCF